MPPRVQRFFLRLLRYDYVLTFVPGKQLNLADMLSRSPGPGDGTPVDTTDVDLYAVSMVSSLVSEKTSGRLARKTASEPYLKLVLQKVTQGETVEGPLASMKSELSVVNSIFFKGMKVVIAAKMRAEMLKGIHEGHLGVGKCKARVRQLVYWPSINSDIESLVQKCAVCRRHAYSQPAEPLMLRKTPTQVWYRVGADIF